MSMIEILSPGNTNREMKTKYEVYEEAGVLEYWIVNPDYQYILAYTLSDAGIFVAQKPYTTGMTIHSSALQGFSVNLDELFSNL